MFSGHCDNFVLFFALWQKFMRVVLYALLLLFLSWCRSCIAGGVLFRLKFSPISSFSLFSVSFYPILTGVLPVFIFLRCGRVALIHCSSSSLLHPRPDFTFFPLFSRLFRSFIFLCPCLLVLFAPLCVFAHRCSMACCRTLYLLSGSLRLATLFPSMFLAFGHLLGG